MYINLNNNGTIEIPDEMKKDLCDKFFGVIGSTIFLGIWVIVEQVLPFIESIDGNSLTHVLYNKFLKRKQNMYAPIRSHADNVSEISELSDNLSRTG